MRLLTRLYGNTPQLGGGCMVIKWNSPLHNMRVLSTCQILQIQSHTHTNLEYSQTLDYRAILMHTDTKLARTTHRNVWRPH